MTTRRLRWAAACASLSLALSGCGDGDDDTPASPTPSATTAAPTASPGTSPTPSPTATVARAVYYLRDVQPAGPRLYREFHPRPDVPEAVRDAVAAMLAEAPRDPDYTTLWPSGTEVLGVQVDGDLATVDLSERATQGNAGAAFEAASIQQLVHTVTAADPAVRRVQLRVAGQVRETLWGHVDTSGPIARAPQEETLGPVWIIEPEEGGSVARGGRVTGAATVFEATVSWEWVQGGTVVAQGFSTATEGAPGRGEWSAPVDVPAGDYELRAFSASAEDGSPMFSETKKVTVTG